MKQGILSKIISILLCACGVGFCDGRAMAEPNEVNTMTNLPSYLRYAELHSAALKASLEDQPHGQTFGISQMLPWFGTSEAATGMASAEKKAAQHRYQSQRLGLLFTSTKQENPYVGLNVHNLNFIFYIFLQERS
jgi:hypothetical protein